METDTIYCGECAQVMRDHIEDSSIDLTVTSPPYDNLRKYNGFVFPFEEIAKELYRVTKIGGVVVWVVADATIKGSETGTSFRQALFFKEIGFNVETMIYQRNFKAYNATQHYYPQTFEYMFLLSKQRITTFNPIKDRKNKSVGKARRTSTNRGKEVGKYHVTSDEYGIRTNIWYIPNGNNHTTKDKITHPAPFPEKLAEDHILSWSNENDIVFDPMCGSGTTLKMAKKNNRGYIGIDISQEYVELSQRRVNGT